MDTRIKKSLRSFCEYTTTDGRVFSGSQASKNAQKHQKEVDIEAQKESIKRDLWVALGLPEDKYDGIFYPLDTNKDSPEWEKKLAKDLLALFENFGIEIYGDEPGDFDEFAEAVFDIFLKYHDQCKIVMAVLEKYIK